MREKKFHQMIYVQYGPAKSVIFDFLKKIIYRVSTEELKAFQNRGLEEDSQFVQNLVKEDLIIEFEAGAWIPSINLKINERYGDRLIFKIFLTIQSERRAIIERFFRYSIYFTHTCLSPLRLLRLSILPILRSRS